MKQKSIFLKGFIKLISVFVLFTLAACAASPSQQPAAEQAAADSPEGSTPVEAIEATATLEPTQAPTATIEPTSVPPTPTPVPEALVITSQGFGQTEIGDIGFAFMVENPNQSFAIQGSQYQVSFFDESGAEVGKFDGYMGALLPGQTLGVAGEAYLGGDIRVDKTEITLTQGKEVGISDLPAGAVFNPLVAEDVNYFPAADQYSNNVVSGLVVNPYDQTLGYTRVSFIAYDTAGEIIGGGWETLGFVPALGKAAFSGKVISSGEVARVETYPAVNGVWDIFVTRKLPEGAQAPTLEKQGYMDSGNGSVGYGYVIQNPNSNYLVVQNVQITFYAEDGSVLGTVSEQINLSPNSTMGYGGYANVREGAGIARAEFLIHPEVYRESSEITPLTVKSYTVEEQGGGWKTVRGEVSSSAGTDLENVKVYAVVYNDAGEVVGGGLGRVEKMPANGEASLELQVFAPATAASVEFFTHYDVE